MHVPWWADRWTISTVHCMLPVPVKLPRTCFHTHHLLGQRAARERYHFCLAGPQSQKFRVQEIRICKCSSFFFECSAHNAGSLGQKPKPTQCGHHRCSWDIKETMSQARSADHSECPSITGGWIDKRAAPMSFSIRQTEKHLGNELLLFSFISTTSQFTVQQYTFRLEIV